MGTQIEVILNTQTERIVQLVLKFPYSFLCMQIEAILFRTVQSRQGTKIDAFHTGFTWKLWHDFLGGREVFLLFPIAKTRHRNRGIWSRDKLENFCSYFHFC